MSDPFRVGDRVLVQADITVPVECWQHRGTVAGTEHRTGDPGLYYVIELDAERFRERRVRALPSTMVFPLPVVERLAELWVEPST